MFIFYALFKRLLENYEAITLRLTLWAMFEIMGPNRPNAIMIDKIVTKLKFFTIVIIDHPWC